MARGGRVQHRIRRPRRGAGARSVGPGPDQRTERPGGIGPRQGRGNPHPGEEIGGRDHRRIAVLWTPPPPCGILEGRDLRVQPLCPTGGGKTMARFMYSPAHKKNVTRETDPYLPKKTAPSLSICPECRAVCRKQRWYLDEREHALLTRKKGAVTVSRRC